MACIGFANKHMKLITKPNYPRCFTSTGPVADEVLWEWTVSDFRTNPNHYLENLGPQFLYDMLLDALDRISEQQQ